jgi:hypothetical protein
MYSKEEKLKLFKPVWITKKEYETLREQKKKTRNIFSEINLQCDNRKIWQ